MQNLLPRKSSPQNHCDGTGNGVIYEDMPTLRARPLPHCPPQTLSSIEVSSIPELCLQYCYATSKD